MSWTTEFLESSAFKVKNTDEVREVLICMGFATDLKDGFLSFYSQDNEYFDEDTEVVLSLKPFTREGETKPTNIIGIISDSCIESVDLSELEEGTYMVQSITEYLQDQLIDEKQYITITNVGFEGRMSGNSNPFGDIYFITKNTVKFSSLYATEQKFKEECGITE